MSRRMIWLERACWSIGLVLVLGVAGVRLWSEQARAQGVAEARQAMQKLAMPVADQTLWSQERVSAYRQSPKDAPEAVLRIPSIKLEVPVYGNTSELNLNRGAGHIEGTAQPEDSGNVGLAAHRDGFFRKLKDAALEEEIFLEHPGGTARYRITEIQIVSPEDSSVLRPTRVPSLTLVTCYPFYFVGNAPQRYIVRAELVEAQRLREEDKVQRNIQRSQT